MISRSLQIGELHSLSVSISLKCFEKTVFNGGNFLNSWKILVRNGLGNIEITMNSEMSIA